MQITFYGAVREVTGSMHLIKTEEDNILLDCGLFQGRRKETAEKNKNLPFDAKILTNIVLSHAHIDHSGRIPLLTKNDFAGRIISTRATEAACEYLLLDSAHIQESDAAYLNYKMVRNTLSQMNTSGKGKKKSKGASGDIKKVLKKNHHNLDLKTIHEMIDKYHLDAVHPLYSIQDAEEALTYFDSYPYRHSISIGRNITCTQYEAGHILGSAISIIRAEKDGQKLTVCYTGDMGRFDKPIVKDPNLVFEEADRRVDLLVMESTYGDRIHEPVVDLKPRLKDVISETYNRGGTILIPSFAYGRTQELLYMLHELYNENDVPRMPVYVDSPLATKITRVFGEHPEAYDEETHETFLEKGKNPFYFKQVQFVSSVEESMALNRDETPHIVIAASGMCEAGRILHHLRYKIHDPKSTILIVGFMAQHTLGRRILDKGLEYEASGRKGQPPLLKILNKEYPLKAQVVKLDGFSAHADKTEMLRFLKESNLEVERIALVHGEEDQTLAFSKELKTAGYKVVVPKQGETISVGD